MAKKRKVDFSLASEVFEDASLTDSLQSKPVEKTRVLLSSLQTNPHQPRITIDENAIKELANSINENGLLQPITVLDNQDSTYTIVFGHRRVAAYEFLDKKEIEATILQSLEDKKLVISPIVENLQRKDMEPLETAMALDKVLQMGIIKTQNELSKSLGISQGRISKLLSILKLSKNVLHEIRKSNYKDVTVLAALNKIDVDKQFELFKTIHILPRNEALEKIKQFQTKKIIEDKRIIHGNGTIKINTKNLSKQKKDQLFLLIKKIELLLGASNG